MAPTFLLALLAQTVAPPLVNPSDTTLPPRDLGFNDPPIELIDFLGRRKRCAEGRMTSEWSALLRCAALPGEERAFRSRFAGDANALRWLDQAPLAFRMSERLIARFDGPTRTRPRSAAQSGVDESGRLYRLTIDARADAGRSTRISASYDGGPEHSFTLSNRAFPLIDLRSLAVGAYTIPGHRRLEVELHYGYARGYCGEIGEDDRPKVRISFERTRVHGTDTRRDNCQRLYVEIENADARR
jgi:hypothetical protein